MNIYIPDIEFCNYPKSELFTAIRPFLKDNILGNYPKELEKWGINFLLKFVNNKDECDFIIYPLVLSSSGLQSKKFKLIEKFALANSKYRIIVYISGDYGYVYPKLNNVIYYRMGGFNTQLPCNNKIMPFLLSDHLSNLMGVKTLNVRDKTEIPVVGFCGHASYNFIKYLYEKYKFIKLNFIRFFKLNFKFENYFSSAYNRKIILNKLTNSKLIISNFIFRQKYRGGYKSNVTKLNTTLEYYQNILNSDYIICVRGGGNFSVRFYETLLMGRIPVLIDTDCKLPFEEIIDWNKHIIRVPWKDRYKVDIYISEFHSKLTNEKFIELQYCNRNLWVRFLNLNGFFLELSSLC